MSTSFYWLPNHLPHDVDLEDAGAIHIGKHSIGFPFMLRIHLQQNIHTLTDWLEKAKTGHIYDDSCEDVDLERLIDQMKVAEKLWRDIWSRYYGSAPLPGTSQGEAIVFEHGIAHTRHKDEFS